jgi:hypothetical protein
LLNSSPIENNSQLSVGSPRLWSRRLGHPPKKNHCCRDVLACQGEGRQLFIMAIVVDVPLNVTGPEASCSDIAVSVLSLDGSMELS